MSKKSRQIAEEIVAMAEYAKKAMVIETGIVQSVNTDDYTCVVALNTQTAGTLTEAITINAALEVTDGLIMLPAKDSVVWVAKLDGGGNRGLVKCSKLDKVLVKIGDLELSMDSTAILLNGDDLGGVPKAIELKTQLNKNNILLAHIMAIINGPPVTEPGNGAPSALQIALKSAISSDQLGDFSNIENPNVKHG